MLVFDSGIAETAIVGNVTGDRVFFKEPLGGQPVGNKPLSSGWRYLIFNNMALLDAPGSQFNKSIEISIAFSMARDQHRLVARQCITCCKCCPLWVLLCETG